MNRKIVDRSNILLVAMLLLTFILGFVPISFASTRSDINFTFNDVIDSDDISILLSEDLLKYNMEKEIAYLKEYNSSEIDISLSKLEKFLKDGDYLEYVKYMATFDADNNEEEKGNIVLASTYFLFNASKIGSYYTYSGKKYIEIRPALTDTNVLTLELKDFLKYYIPLDIKVKIDDEKAKAHLIDLKFETDSETEKETNLDDYNIVINCTDFTYYTEEKVEEDDILSNASSLISNAPTSLLRYVIIVFVVVVLILVGLLVLVIKKVR